MRQEQRTRQATKQIERVEEERPERDARADEVSEQADCCLADIDAAIEEACCLIAEVAEKAPTEEEFKAEQARLQQIYYDLPFGKDNEAHAALRAYENKWPQFAPVNTCVC
jgi:chromosome segregation ATPase